MEDRHFLFTSESVTEGHPDKICDQISDAILDALIREDPMSRVACETCVTTGLVLVMGEITTKAYVDIQQIVRETVNEIGYNRAKYGFDGSTCAVLTAIDEQSADIALGVDNALEVKENEMDDEELDRIGAGDQGMMFGYASDETPEYMPYPIALAHKLTRRLAEVRKNGTLKYLRPDGKSQVTIEYNENHEPVRIDTVVLSTQHNETVSLEELKEDIRREVFEPVLPKELLDERTRYFINPTGRFHRRPAGRLRSYRTEDHCRHLRRHGTPRRRRILRQGSDQGGPFRVLRAPLCGEECRGGRPCEADRDPDLLCDRRCETGIPHR